MIQQFLVNYVKYLQRHYGTNTIVVFDGYAANAANRNTKCAETYRHSRAHVSIDVISDAAMCPPVSQERFLGSDNVTRYLMSILITKFEEQNYTVKQAAEDANVFII